MSDEPTAAPTPRTRTRTRFRVPYEPGIDGLRAIAVTSVLLYHHSKDAFSPMVPGGFFGVEVFFVISGYLITALLLAEYRNRQHIALGQFYLRRARRLLPALFLMLAVVGLYSVLFLPDEVHTLRGDTFGALAYIQNWWQIYAGRSYFAQTGRPPLLQHLWSLAVEEQFYLIWPLLFAGLLRLWGRRPSRIVWTIVGGALASTALMWILFPGDPLRASRVYYGTDTRASGLLLGAALAMLWAPWRLTPRITAAGRAVLDLAGAVGLAVILIFLFEVPDDATWIYRGGFLLLGLATLLVIAATVHPGADVGRVLGVRPLVWVGLRSYSLYVWHWPIYQVTRPDLDVPLHGYALLALRLTLTVIVAELSYRFVETPIRQGALSRAWRAMREGAMAPATRQRATAVLAGSAVLLLVVGVGFAGAKEPPPPEEFRGRTSISGVVGGTGTAGPTGATGASGTSGATGPSGATATVPPPPPLPARIAVGDSVMLGAAASLGQVFPGIVVNAAVSRQFGSVADVVGQLHAGGYGRDLTVVHTGTNGSINADRYTQMLRELSDVRCVVVLNLKVPRSWEKPNNRVLEDITRQFPNAVVVNWNGIATPHPEWFYGDGIHLNAAGRAAYAQIISNVAPTCGR